MAERVEPSPVRALLGQEMRLARVAAGLTQQQLAEKTFCRNSLVSMIETGQRNTSHDTIELIDATSGCGGRLVRMWKVATKEGMSAIIGELVEAEQKATIIRSYHPVFVPGLLQTEAYARALLGAGRLFGASEDQIEERVAGRLERQEILSAGRLRSYRVILDESVLLRPIGGPDVMRQQLASLLERTSSHLINVQLMPLTESPYSSSGPMVIVDMNGSKVVHLEDALGGTTIRDPDKVSLFEGQFEILRSQAASVPQTARMIAARMEEL